MNELATMKAKTDFKQTEVGLIPEDWDLHTIKSLTPEGVKYGIVDGPFGSNLKTEHYKSKGIPIITSGYVTNGYFSADKYLFVTQEKFKQEKRSAVKGGDIVMAKIGARCGASAILPLNHEVGILSGNALKISIDEKKYSTTLIWSFLQDLYRRGNLGGITSIGAQPAISMSNLKEYKIPLPPTLDEQKAIATALSDVDALIQSLDALIAKKKAIKQGAMQELLTPPHSTSSGQAQKGEKRLDGFSGEWVEKKLGEVADFYKGKGLPKSEIIEDGKFPCIHYGELFTKYDEIIKQILSRTNKIEDTFKSKVNDVLMPTSDVTPNGLATASSIYEEGVILGGDVLVIRPNLELYGSFLSYLISNSKEQILSLVTGSTVYHLYGSDMARFKFLIPSLEEQKAIAQILSDMDLEIASLEKKKGKYEEIKQGMMQELLTGRVRIVNVEL